MSEENENNEIVHIDKNSTKIDDSLLDSRFECPICINWLNEPVLTSCGHRFCKLCITSWLKNQTTATCPLDNKLLTLNSDIFPDNFTRREIAQIKIICRYTKFGCHLTGSPTEMDQHSVVCPFNPVNDLECPFRSLNCLYISKSKEDIEKHIKSDLSNHMLLLVNEFNKNKQMPTSADLKSWEPQKQLPQRNEEADENLVRALYSRVVVLEQKCREQDVKLEKLKKELNAKPLSVPSSTVDPKYSNGVIIWEIEPFSSFIDQMKSNLNTLFYSMECYTSPYGYKFCGRINIPAKKDFISLHVHLMQSENDYHLDWPFNGRIKITMIHPKNRLVSQHDVIMSKPEILAFHQPSERISPRGFGFVEYAKISDIYKKEFIENDKLIFKIQLNIV